MLPDSHLKEIIEHYWDSKEKKVHDYDFRKEALMAQLILDLRLIYKSVKKPSQWVGPG
jgi:hypothetical protein